MPSWKGSLVRTHDPVMCADCSTNMRKKKPSWTLAPGQEMNYPRHKRGNPWSTETPSVVTYLASRCSFFNGLGKILCNKCVAWVLFQHSVFTIQHPSPINLCVFVWLDTIATDLALYISHEQQTYPLPT